MSVLENLVGAVRFYSEVDYVAVLADLPTRGTDHGVPSTATCILEPSRITRVLASACLLFRHRFTAVVRPLPLSSLSFATSSRTPRWLLTSSCEKNWRCIGRTSDRAALWRAAHPRSHRFLLLIIVRVRERTLQHAPRSVDVCNPCATPYTTMHSQATARTTAVHNKATLVKLIKEHRLGGGEFNMVCVCVSVCVCVCLSVCLCPNIRASSLIQAPSIQCHIGTYTIHHTPYTIHYTSYVCK